MQQPHKVMIAVPNLGHIHTDLVQRILMWHFTRSSWETITLFAPRGFQPHDSARNVCVNAFLQTDMTHLFFVDSDVVPPQEALETLLAADKDIIAAPYACIKTRDNVEVKEYAVYDRKPIKGTNEWRLEEAKGEGIREVDRAGTGCLLIKRRVLDTLEKPIFKFGYGDTGIMAIGEDINFCRRAQESGFKIHAHHDVKCKHAKEMLI